MVNPLRAVLLRRRAFAAVEIFFEKLLFSRVSCKSVYYAVNSSRQNQEYDVEIREERDNKRSRGNQVGLPVFVKLFEKLDHCVDDKHHNDRLNPLERGCKPCDLFEVMHKKGKYGYDNQ